MISTCDDGIAKLDMMFQVKLQQSFETPMLDTHIFCNYFIKHENLIILFAILHPCRIYHDKHLLKIFVHISLHKMV
jgi:hypothetical protein